MGEEQLAKDLAGAVRRGEIVAFFQPQLDLTTGRIAAAEALARWRHPELGLISPGLFIPLAEQTRVIHSLGNHMINEVLATASSWRAQGVNLELSVNVSPDQLTTLEFFDRLDEGLDTHELSPWTVTIEITENLPVLETPSISRRLTQLRDRGLGISIDDYGKGYASLELLDRMPATELKLDMSLVQDDGPEAHALMAAVTELAHWRGLRVVAEGVETESQLRRVRDLGCDRAQGYYFHRPLPAEAFESLVG